MVYLVGAGPGSPDLITVRGKRLLRAADVVVHDRLIDAAILSWTESGAEIIDMARSRDDHRHRQAEINELIVARARAGLMVVRLKGGDPLVFGRGYEEAEACSAAGIASVVVPGISSALAAPAAAGISITERKSIRSFCVVTAEVARDCQEQHLDFASLAGVDAVVFLMGRDKLADLANGLIAAGKNPHTPVACIQSATTATQRVIASELALIAGAADDAGLAAPIVTVIGDIARRADESPRKIVGPLGGQTVVLTRPPSSGPLMVDSLRAVGARVIECPLTRITPAETTGEIRNYLGRVDAYDWLLLTSFNAVRAFVRQLRSLHRDVRALGSCRVGVVGPSTARAARKIGIEPDLVAEPHSATGLLRTLSASFDLARATVLYPHSDRAESTLVDGLHKFGAEVDAFVAYRNDAIDPEPALLAQVRQEADMIVLCSPSAARRSHRLGLLSANRRKIACIGPTTAAAVNSLGHRVDIMPVRHTAGDLVRAIVSDSMWEGVTD
jgi:uroporphyrinogen III methyltransferase/synthase